MESILAYLDKIEDILEESRAVPFSSRVSVDKGSIYEIIDEIRLNLPKEIRQAQRLLVDSEKILNDAKTKSQTALRDADTQKEQLISEHTITQMAEEHAKKIIEESKKTALEMHINARMYADEILEKTEQTIKVAVQSMMQQSHDAEEFLNETINVIYNNRQELRTMVKKPDER